MTADKILKTGAFYLLVLVIVVFSVFPFYYAIITSFATGTQLFEVSYFPQSFNWANYESVLGGRSFVRSIFNSVFIATLTVCFALFLAVTASYALARVRFRGRGLLLMCILAVSMFPQIAVLAGLFELVRFLGIFNTPWAMILSYTIFTLPFTVWVLTTFMRDLPVEIEEAAIVDGATPWVIITQVFMPLLWPALVTTGLLAFIGAWNEFLFALTFTSSETTRTTPVAIGLLSGASQQEIPWGPIMAASVIVTVPIVVLVLIFQRKIVAGLTSGGVKG
jgi:trehalose/maltose transport system permease protein